jgi:predicted ATPase/transcriptional regulator with XRE-family HTH domain/Tfp pilus assembly protein PilF
MNNARLYKLRDYECGLLFQSLRNRARLRQQDIAEMVGVGVNTVQYWESGTTYPKAETLKKLVEIYLRYGLFSPGKELTEAFDLWERVRQEAPRLNASFDRSWFQDLVARVTQSRPPAPEFTSLVPRPSHNLPVRLTSFIGRRKELAVLGFRLSQNLGATASTTPSQAARLLTLIGEGGCGKTSLALHVAREKLADYPQGIWLVELAPLTLEPEIIQALAALFGLQSQGRRPLLDQLIDYLREKQLLLVLDNCEHLIEACARVVTTLLEECPKVQILATSREALKVRGEFVLRVPSLSLPETKNLLVTTNAATGLDGQPWLNELLTYEAIALFFERAQNASPHFKLTPHNHKTVVDICQRLDGIPLALELAAARLRVLSIDELDERLQDRFRLLRGGSDRTVSPRHRTLQAAVDWSYDLLTPPERILFRRLSIFAGGWNLNAAEEICGFGEVSKSDILDLLHELVDKSLVVVEETGQPERGQENDQKASLRFKLLQTLRDYGQQRLVEASLMAAPVSEWGNEAQTLQVRHLLYFSAFATRLVPDNGWGQSYLERKEACRLLETEQINLIEGLNRGTASPLEERLVKAALELAGPLAFLWNEKNSYQECVYHLALLKQKAQEAGLSRSLPYGRVTDWLGLGIFYTGDPAQARLIFQQAFEVFTGLEDKRGIMRSLLHLGTATIIQGDHQKAFEYFLAGLREAYELGEKEDIVTALRNLGTASANLGEFKKAREYFETGLKMARENGDPEILAGLLVHAAPLVAMSGDYELAQNYLLESLPLLRTANKKILLSSSLGNLGIIADYQEDYEGSFDYLQQALAIQKEIGFMTNIAISLHNLANLSLKMAKFDEAVKFNAESKLYFQKTPGQTSTALIAFTEGSLEEYHGSYAPAIQKKREALAIFWETKELHYTLNILKDLARLAYLQFTSTSIGASQTAGLSLASQPVPVPEKVSWLLGAVSKLLGEIEEKFKPSEQQELDRITGECRYLMGAETYERLFNEGAATPLAEVLDRVLSPAFL